MLTPRVFAGEGWYPQDDVSDVDYPTMPIIANPHSLL